MSKKKLGIVALLAALALVLPLSVAAHADTPLIIDLHNNTAPVAEDCPDDGLAYWHFVIVPNNGNSEFVEFHLNLDGTITDISDFLDNNGQLDNVFVAVPDGKTITSLITDGSTADISWDGTPKEPTSFNLSHICPGDEGGDTSEITTEVHLGATDGASATPVDNDNPAALGSTVHDSAHLTFTGGGTLPAGSSVTFFFYLNNDCSGDEFTSSTPFDVSGEDSPVDIDPAFAQGPLGAGEYSYTASFLSGDEAEVASSAGDCEPFKVDKGNTETVTTIVEETDGTSLPIYPIPHLPLGTTVHDTAVVNGQVGTFVISGTVTYHFYKGIGCDTTKEQGTGETFPIDELGAVPDSSSKGPLGAGEYSFNAKYDDDANYNSSELSKCEPFVIDQSDTLTTTQVHDAAHNDITNKGVKVGAYVHDSATVVGDPLTPFTIGGTVTYSFFTNGGCDGTTLDTETVAVGTESTPKQINTPGAYSYSATYNGDDDNYNGSTGLCEPFSVFQPGKTMGFWGNRNGQARIIAGGGYLANAVNIGRGANIDTQTESLKVLPLTLNACGKGTPFIFTVGAQTASANCTLATGVNFGSLNTLSAQTLALGYNIKLVTGFTNQPLSLLGCTPVGSLTSSSTVNDAFTAAVLLIDGSFNGGTTTQPQIGAMNTLLGCLNAEA